MAKKRTDTPRDATVVEKADIAVAEVAADNKRHPLARAVGAIGHLGDQPPMLAASAIVLAGGLLGKERRLVRAGVRMIAAELVTIVLKDLVKRSVTRTRPHLLLEEGRYERRPGGPHEGRFNSFPSGHTAGAVACARALTREYPELAGPAYGFAAAVAVGQVPNAAHYPTDVGAGAVVGLVSELIVDSAVRAIDARLEG
jgi:membrane-associated phospholipid phosphatase